MCTANAECIPELPPPPPGAVEAGAYAPPPGPPPAPPTHKGLMLRFTGGWGWSRWSQHLRNSSGIDLKDDGTTLGTFLTLDAGGSPIENLAIHARVSLLFGPGPDVAGDDNSVFFGSLIAPAVTYYFMPANVYATLAAGISWISFESGDGNGNTHGNTIGPGFGMNADIGKEWWVNHELVGLGGAVRFWFCDVGETHGDLDVNADLFGVALLFSMTYR